MGIIGRYNKLLQFVHVYGFILLDYFGTFGIVVLMVCWCKEVELWSKQGCIFGLGDEAVL